VKNPLTLLTLRPSLLLSFIMSLGVALHLPVAHADELTADKAADIKKLMQLTTGANVAQQFAAAMSHQIFQVLKQAKPAIPERAGEIQEHEAVAVLSEQMVAPGGLMEQLIPVYDRNFTAEEIKGLLDFYATPLGKKTIGRMPKVMQESMLIGQAWGKSLGPEIQKRMKAALERDGLLPASAGS
jgi:hypothetical protein